MNSTNTDATEKRNLVLARVTKVCWFFLCLFGCIAAIGLLSFRADLANWELYLQLGVLGGSASLLVLGALQLGHAFVSGEGAVLQRLKRVAGFFLATSGSLLPLGTLFEALKYPNAQSFMWTGLMGTAASLAVVGLLVLWEAYSMETSGEDEGRLGSDQAKQFSSAKG